MSTDSNNRSSSSPVDASRRRFFAVPVLGATLTVPAISQAIQATGSTSAVSLGSPTSAGKTQQITAAYISGTAPLASDSALRHQPLAQLVEQDADCLDCGLIDARSLGKGHIDLRDQSVTIEVKGAFSAAGESAVPASSLYLHSDVPGVPASLLWSAAAGDVASVGAGVSCQTHVEAGRIRLSLASAKIEAEAVTAGLTPLDAAYFQSHQFLELTLANDGLAGLARGLYILPLDGADPQWADVALRVSREPKVAEDAKPNPVHTELHGSAVTEGQAYLMFAIAAA